MIKTIQKIGNKVSKKYSVPNPIVTKLFKEKDRKYNWYEIRTELPSYEGGSEFQEKIEKKFPNYIVENQGGCVYIAYRPN